MVKARRNFPHATNWRALHGITNFRHTQIFVYECAKLSPIVEGKQLEGNIRLPLLILTPVWPFKKHATGEKCVGVKTVWDQHWSDIIELVVPKCYPDSLNTSKNHSLLSMLCCPFLLIWSPCFMCEKHILKKNKNVWTTNISWLRGLPLSRDVHANSQEELRARRARPFCRLRLWLPVVARIWSYPPKGNI